MSQEHGTRPRAIVVGVGAITSQGPSATDLWEGVVAGRCAIRPVEQLPMDGYRTTLGGEVQDRQLPTREYRRPEGFRDPVFDFALKAAEEAVDSAAEATASVAPERFGVVIGTCNAGLLSWERWFIERAAGRSAEPELVMLAPPQALAEALAGAFGLRGPVLSVNTACAASANAIGYAGELIRTGQADAVLTGGADALSDVLYSGFNSLESLSPEPAAPYSKDRQGLSLGEGSGMLVLVREDLARASGAPMLAELLGYSLSADGYHATAPHPEGEGAGRAISGALRAAGVNPDEVAYVNSHGTGTAKNDPAETMATKVGLGDAAASVAVSSTKSMIGHLLGAAGAVENIVTVNALVHQIAPPTANFTEADPECDLDYVPNEAREMAVDVAVSNNFAFGGANASTVLARVGVRSDPPTPNIDRIVVTGLGVLSPAGLGPDALVTGVRDGVVFTQDEEGVRIGRAEFDPDPFLTRKERRRIDRLGLFSIISTKLALADAELEIDDDNRARVGVVVGTGVGPMESMEAFASPVIADGAGSANPAVFPNTVYNAAGGQVAMKVGAVGPASTITTGHSASASALCYGSDMVRNDQASCVVAVGADTLTDTTIAAYHQLGLLGPPDSPGIAEAGAAVVLERLGHAQSRGARIYGEILGYSTTSDGLGVWTVDDDGAGVERAMREALERAGLKVEEVKTVWASESAHPAAAAAERTAIDRMFGGQAGVTVNNLTHAIGEPLGVGGMLAATCALSSLEDSSGPVMVNSLSLGGTNISIVLGPFQP